MSSAIQDMHRESIEESLRIVASFPLTFQSAELLSETMSRSGNPFTNVKLKTSVAECLLALKTLAKISAELDLLALSKTR